VRCPAQILFGAALLAGVSVAEAEETSPTNPAPSAPSSLSELRANNVLQGLVSRGIPVERFQVIAKGQTDLVVPTPPDTSEERNRRVEITWR
jgi:outer membrane protein OmpA-like peptidoglycan-associated protein